MTRPTRFNAQQLIELIVDPGTFTPWHATTPVTTTPEPYRTELATAAAHAGTHESIVAGEGTVHGRRVALISSEFNFLGGSLGINAAHLITETFHRATNEGLPVLAATASGGTRMQEGTAAFVHMIAITAAIAEHRAAGLPYLVYLRHPTTGGVFASWGSLAHVTVAEPGALIGFLGPRVFEAMTGKPFPQGIQQAENLAQRGIIDAVAPPEQLRAGLDRTLRIICDPPIWPSTGLPATHPGSTDAWASVQKCNDPHRPGIRDLLKTWNCDLISLNGTGSGETDPGLMLALVRHRGQSFVLLAQDRHRHHNQQLGPGALREARRGMRLATELHLPLVTVIDTPGAALTQEAEEGGLAGEIARCLADLLTAGACTISILLGAGTGGGALALLPADFTIAAEHSWLSPLPPEGASAIIHKTTEHAPAMAQQLGIASAQLLATNIVDHIVAEQPDAASNPTAFSQDLSDALVQALAINRKRPLTGRVARRGARYRNVLPMW